MAITTRKSKLSRVTNPTAVSLVDRGSNQATFRVLRGDDGKAVAQKVTKKPAQSEQASRKDKILSYTLPPGATQTDAEAFIEIYGLNEGEFELSEREDGRLVLARRSDEEVAQMEGEVVPINLHDGTTVSVKVNEPKANAGERFSGVALAAIEIDKDYYPSREEADNWMSKFGVTGEVEEVEGGYIVTRTDADPDQPAAKLSLGEGVKGIFIQSERNDVPESMVGAIPIMYGQYGWGHLSFASAMADITFSDVADRAVWVLRDVLDEVLIWSNLPIQDRKALMSASLNQFGQFMGELIDGMPTSLVTQERSDVKRQSREENIMAIKTENAGVAPTKAQRAAAEREAGTTTANEQEEQVTRSDGETTEGEETTQTQETQEGEEVTRSAEEETTSTAEGEGQGEGEGTTAAADDDQPVKRSELKDLVAAAVTEAITAQGTNSGTGAAQGEGTGEEVQAARSDDQGEGEGDPLKEILGVMKEMGESVKSLAKRVDDVESITVVRDDEQDEEGVTEKRSDQPDNPFKGVFARHRA